MFLERPGLGCHRRRRSPCLASDHTVKSGGPVPSLGDGHHHPHPCHRLPPSVVSHQSPSHPPPAIRLESLSCSSQVTSLTWATGSPSASRIPTHPLSPPPCQLPWDSVSVPWVSPREPPRPQDKAHSFLQPCSLADSPLASSLTHVSPAPQVHSETSRTRRTSRVYQVCQTCQSARLFLSWSLYSPASFYLGSPPPSPPCLCPRGAGKMGVRP